MEMTNRLRWTWLLPTTALLCAVVLSFIGKLRTDRILDNHMQVVDYIDPSEKAGFHSAAGSIGIGCALAPSGS